MGCVNCNAVTDKEIKDAIKNLKTIQVVPGNSTFKDAKEINSCSYHLKTHFEIQNPGSMEVEENEESNSILGKRLNDQIIIDIIEFESKQSKQI